MDYSGFRTRKFFIAFLFLYISSSVLLFSGIILKTSDTQVRFALTEITESFPESQSLPICNLSLIAKQMGAGTVTVAHTALSNGTKIIEYSLSYEEKAEKETENKATFRYATTSPDSLQVVHIAKLWAKVREPQDEKLDTYESDVVFNLVLDK
jgi:hypothetical protein